VFFFFFFFFWAWGEKRTLIAPAAWPMSQGRYFMNDELSISFLAAFSSISCLTGIIPCKIKLILKWMRSVGWRRNEEGRKKKCKDKYLGCEIFYLLVSLILPLIDVICAHDTQGTPSEDDSAHGVVVSGLDDGLLVARGCASLLSAYETCSHPHSLCCTTH
jgi:hypothetical protein